MSEQFLSEVDLAARWAMCSKILTHWRGHLACLAGALCCSTQPAAVFANRPFER